MKRRALMGLLPATALLALSVGCTSVPVSTMWRLRNFGAEQLFAVDAAQLRAAARVDSRVKMKNVTLQLEVEPADGSARRSYVIPLEQPTSDARLERPPADRRWFAFALSPQGMTEYQRIKRDYAALPKGSRGTLRIAAADDGSVPDALRKAFPLRVDVLIDPSEGYLTLISETRIDLTRPAKQ